jgi:hypothetical protein
MTRITSGLIMTNAVMEDVPPLLMARTTLMGLCGRVVEMLWMRKAVSEQYISLKVTVTLTKRRSSRPNFKKYCYQALDPRYQKF